MTLKHARFFRHKFAGSLGTVESEVAIDLSPSAPPGNSGSISRRQRRLLGLAGIMADRTFLPASDVDIEE
jgi:hypothetical protein